jgi:hypothetical protein
MLASRRVASLIPGLAFSRFPFNPFNRFFPTLELHDGNGVLLVANDNWQDDPVSANQLMSSGLAPSDLKEAGIFISLPPGAFTAILAGENGSTGIGVVEIYNVP